MSGDYLKTLPLFVDCNRIRELCNQLGRHAGSLQEIAINSSIASRHTGGAVKVFSEITRQVGTNSKSIRNRLTCIHRCINEMANLALQLLILYQQLEKYDQALPGISGEANAAVLRRRIAAIRADALGMHAAIAERAEAIVGAMRLLEQGNNRIWATITLLRIESSALGEEGEALIQPVSDSLAEAHRNLVAVTQELFVRMGHFNERLAARQAQQQGENAYAA